MSATREVRHPDARALDGAGRVHRARLVATVERAGDRIVAVALVTGCGEQPTGEASLTAAMTCPECRAGATP